MELCNGNVLFFLERVHVAIGPTSGFGCQAILHGNSLERCFHTFGGGALGVDRDKEIGNTTLGVIPQV